MVLDLAPGWRLELERGPGWLFVRFDDPKDAPEAEISEHLWQLCEQNLTYRLVIELDRVSLMGSMLLGQLVQLSRRLHARGGLLRICGLSQHAEEALRVTKLAEMIFPYSNREAAVMGERPRRPR